MRCALACVALGLGLASAALAEPNPAVTLSTTRGDIEIELFADRAPATVRNFLAYVDAGFYDATLFHRVISDFVIQGGGFTVDLNRKATRPAIVNEADNGLRNQRGSVSMARTPAVDSATTQFFINLKDNPSLDHGTRDFGYAVFGRVTRGMDVVDAIAGVATRLQKGHPHAPVQPVEIESVERSVPREPAPEDDAAADASDEATNRVDAAGSDPTP